MDWLGKFFIKPLVQGTGYNAVNTLVFGLIFIISLFVIKKILKKKEVKLTVNLFYSLIPFVLLGGILRALQDTGFFNFLGVFRFLFVTPGIYLLVFAISLVSLLIDKKLKWNFLRFSGWFLVGFFLTFVFFNGHNWYGFLVAVGLTLSSFFLAYFLFRKVFERFFFSLPVFAHALDACSSVTAILIIGGFWEQHVVPGFLLNQGLFWLFIPLKIIIALIIVYFIKKESDSEWQWLFLFSLLVLGLGPGTRNLLSILLH